MMRLPEVLGREQAAVMVPHVQLPHWELRTPQEV